MTNIPNIPQTPDEKARIEQQQYEQQQRDAYTAIHAAHNVSVTDGGRAMAYYSRRAAIIKQLAQEISQTATNVAPALLHPLEVAESFAVLRSRHEELDVIRPFIDRLEAHVKALLEGLTLDPVVVKALETPTVEVTTPTVSAPMPDDETPTPEKAIDTTVNDVESVDGQLVPVKTKKSVK